MLGERWWRVREETPRPLAKCCHERERPRGSEGETFRPSRGHSLSTCRFGFPFTCVFCVPSIIWSVSISTRVGLRTVSRTINLTKRRATRPPVRPALRKMKNIPSETQFYTKVPGDVSSAIEYIVDTISCFDIYIYIYIYIYIHTRTYIYIYSCWIYIFNLNVRSNERSGVAWDSLDERGDDVVWMYILLYTCVEM